MNPVRSATEAVTLPAIPNKPVSGAEAVILSLIREGVDTIFGYPGGAIMPIYDAMLNYQDYIKHILVRHEQGATHAADGYAQLAGKPGVCFATSGPGATNLVTGMADAMLDSVPIVCITGQVPKRFLGTDAFQETDVMSLAMPITKWCYQIADVDEIPSIIAKAFYIARSGRPGPVLIDITKCAQFAKTTHPFEYKYRTQIKGYKPANTPRKTDVERAAEIINNAERPIIYTGHGVMISKAEEELVEFVNKSGIPVASTLLGLSSFPTNHPEYVGMLGMHGNYGPNKLSNQCDVVIAIGMRFDDRVTGNLSGYLENAQIIHIEIDQAELGKVVPYTVGMLADAKAALQALIPAVNTRKHTEWVNRIKDFNAVEQEKVIDKDFYSEDNLIKMGQVVKMISEKTNGEAVVVADVGQHQMSAARYSDFLRTDSWISSGGLGTMGYALPASFGAKTAAPDREVVAFIGDGAFQMTLQELGTIAQNKANVKIVILNNNFLGMVRQWQELFFDTRYSSVELQNPDFITIAKGFGIPGLRVEAHDKLEESVDTLLQHDGPFLLEVCVEKEGNVFPMIPSGARIDEIRLE